ncbi:hypothetical protein P7K49_000833 [Saguinus oedipus]|uniref:Uncharacterized protein n=1 Tax=Saguinus oedipus TaxID=9490 RepID=A0ABQ9WCS5_SAGOE|nr:hypothetical protein P7K49_000833 [Saguinus oedipus]
MRCFGNSKIKYQRNEEKAQREVNKKIEKQLQKDKQVYRVTHCLLWVPENLVQCRTTSREAFSKALGDEFHPYIT